MLIKLSKNESLSENDIIEIEKLLNEITQFSNDRNFSNNLDLEFLKKEITKL